jgi:hypothetical protein
LWKKKDSCFYISPLFFTASNFGTTQDGSIYLLMQILKLLNFSAFGISNPMPLGWGFDNPQPKGMGLVMILG